MTDNMNRQNLERKVAPICLLRAWEAHVTLTDYLK